MTPSHETWVDVGALADIPVRGARVVKTPRDCLAVFRSGIDEALAIDDRCPHAGGPLSEGIVHGRSVTCPLHNWVISLETGVVQGAGEGRVKTIPLKLEDGRILLELTGLAPARAA